MVLARKAVSLLEDSIKWTSDPDFGYDVVDVDAAENQDLLDKVPPEILQPRRYFESEGRIDEYRDWVGRMMTERQAFLRKHHVDEAIIDSVSIV